MRRKRTMRVEVLYGGVLIGFSKMSSHKDGTAIDSRVPQDKRMREFGIALLAMALHEWVDQPWMKTKLGSILGALSVGKWNGEVEGLYDHPQPHDNGVSGEDTTDIPF